MEARRVDDGTSRGVIRDPEDALGDGRDKIGGVNPGIETNNAMCARSIRELDVLDISYKSTDRSKRMGRSSRGTDTSRILYLPKSIDTIWGQRRASGSMVICTITSIRRETLGIMRLAI